MADTTPMENGGPRGKPGRPRKENPAAQISEHRRAQIRNAQKTFRMNRNARMKELEDRCNRSDAMVVALTDALNTAYHLALSSDLSATHPDLMKVLQDATQSTEADAVVIPREQAVRRVESPTGRSLLPTPAASVRGTCERLGETTQVPFGYFISGNKSRQNGNVNLPAPAIPQKPATNEAVCAKQSVQSASSCLVGYLTPPSSYSYLESSFSRCLQRNSLEKAYRLFEDPRSDPRAVFQKFRLVQCMRDREKMAAGFCALLRRSAGQPLELFGLPFYCLGGAGKHYVRRDASRRSLYPENMRLPKRILGLGDTATSCSRARYEEQIAALGYDGEWFDSYEVEEYLMEKGFHPEAHMSTIGNLHIGHFAEVLSSRAVLLGRAPGYRKTDIDDAINASLILIGG
ncbi:hypothetical protein K505DRAFT_330478 [Melanomma pulvis-pyrius CBS 109.77]|uniref:BZIP domain-containing protein n=1 Tax=Melanomma pulvis-pyrius CBS 109.77 TaxID=1314802 RepID=A0A6A6WQT4_9PLEO|nr:hypothetical protein K505DRAFT_330478 [Melanomma pulvis-pyrius CBS 109.77]